MVVCLRKRGQSAALADYKWPRRWETPRSSKARCCTGVGVVIRVKQGRPSAGWMRLAVMVPDRHRHLRELAGLPPPEPHAPTGDMLPLAAATGRHSAEPRIG